MKINFLYRGIKPVKEISNGNFKGKIKRTAEKIFSDENVNAGYISIVFCNDIVIREYNSRFLGHDYETDIITFYDYDEIGNTEGELLISLDTVKNNSERFGTEFLNETGRVIIHGVLHLCGYKDGTAAGKSKMRKKENIYLKFL